MLSTEELQRYARHIRLENVGKSGQEKLKNAKVLVIGAGGLGCPVLQYLTAAGIGTIGVIDHDTIDTSNLQRQILFNTEDVGHKKAEVATQRLSQQNPFVAFNTYTDRLSTENAIDLFNQYDIIIDGTDNFPTRYLVNDACVIANKPLVFGSIFKFEGQVSVFNYQGGPSYRCLYPTPPKDGEVPNCSDIGVIGILPGVIGTRMATECIKMILGIGTTLSGKLLVSDLLSNRDLTLNVERNDSNFSRTELESSYEDFCGIKTMELPLSITAIELKKRIEQGEHFHFIDVREFFEIEICAITGSQFIPLREIPARIAEIDRATPTVVVCHHGVRSANAIQYLNTEGFSNLINLTGGIHSWATDVDHEMATY